MTLTDAIQTMVDRKDYEYAKHIVLIIDDLKISETQLLIRLKKIPLKIYYF